MFVFLFEKFTLHNYICQNSFWLLSSADNILITNRVNYSIYSHLNYTSVVQITHKKDAIGRATDRVKEVQAVLSELLQ